MNRNLRLLMTADTVGGVWTYCMELARGLAPHGVEIALATMGAPVSPQQRQEVAALDNVVLHESEYALEWMDDPWVDVRAAGGWLLGIGEAFKPDLVHLNGFSHAALPWSAPVVVVAHSCVFSWWRAVKGEDPPANYEEYKRSVEKGLRAADVVAAPSAEMLRALEDHYQFFTERRVIPNGRDGALFREEQKGEIIFSAGRLWDEAKDASLLVRIAERLNWEVRIAGATLNPEKDGPLVERPCDNGSGGRGVTQLGHLDSGELASCLACASIYAAPARYEPFGLGILEAALSGCALVLSDLPSLRENWESAAVFVPPRDESAWIAALNKLATDEQTRALLAKQARRRARCFATRAMVGQYLNLYRELAPGCFPLRQEVAA